MKFHLQKVGVALTLAYMVGTPIIFAILLFADNSNPVLLECIVFWLQRTKPALHFMTEACIVPLCASLARAASWYVSRCDYAHIDEITPTAPLLDRMCSDIITDYNSLAAFYRARTEDRAPRPPPCLCPNGDHGNVEETLIILREHAQKITGAAIMAVFLSALLTCTLQALSSVLPAAATTANTAVSSAVQVSTAPAPMLTEHEQFQADFDVVTGTAHA